MLGADDNEQELLRQKQKHKARREVPRNGSVTDVIGAFPPGSGTAAVPLPAGKFLETVLFVTEKQPTSIELGWSARKPSIDVARVSA